MGIPVWQLRRAEIYGHPGLPEEQPLAPVTPFGDASEGWCFLLPTGAEPGDALLAAIGRALGLSAAPAGVRLAPEAAGGPLPEWLAERETPCVMVICGEEALAALPDTTAARLRTGEMAQSGAAVLGLIPSLAAMRAEPGLKRRAWLMLRRLMSALEETGGSTAT